MWEYADGRMIFTSNFNMKYTSTACIQLHPDSTNADGYVSFKLDANKRIKVRLKSCKFMLLTTQCGQ